MTTVGFIGLGIMGSPMAVHLAEGGFEVTGYNRTAAKTAPLVAAGGRAAASIADAVDGADVIALMLPDTPDVEAVLTAADGVFAHARADSLIIDFSTIRPDATTELARQAAELGLQLLDAPVSGGEAGAKAATLSIMVGGDVAAFEAAQPVFAAVGRTIVRVGPSGSGQTVKAANQLVVAGTIELVAEALVFLEASGVDTAAAFDVLAGGLAGSRVLDQKRLNLLERSFAPGFRIDLHHKDLGIVVDAARAAGVVIPVGAVVAQLMAAARLAGDGGLDHSALLRGVERLSGRAT